ncbi:hypothetical protein A3D03_05270 [Candidatus Gottesmanbacteria bacterium RIFCSPHIGHO2_02_FULL_40_13]|uniref:Uncharacterized protein n=1 Tax=Candidatus Gottesmanbacteria bacterium RIFCSPHIGHO2_02_FULL_40_13 TaxID=1798384 RepID=A0A1F6A7S8_9BACT|nr:MAG: hypothetical protein A3D03_05270 [Candidatus Gottesmanbacteria bacterium RIFCSPHIGHO2_02_FULL_40_13]
MSEVAEMPKLAEVSTPSNDPLKSRVVLLPSEGMQHEQIKRVTWLDLYPINEEEKEVLGEKFDGVREEVSAIGTTPGVIRTLNKLAFTDNVDKKERLAWLKIKGWIFEQVIINQDKATSTLVEPSDIDKVASEKRNRSRMAKEYDNWSGIQKGIYARPLFPMPISLLDYVVTPEQIVDAEKFDKLNPTEVPGNFENFVANRLIEIEKLKTDPVVYIDFGGVQSISTLRLALKFKKEVEQGKMVFIVTNLSADKDRIEKFVRRAGYRDEEAWLLEAMKLVHYVQADAQELEDMTVSLPNERSIKINGNADFIHEADAISAHGFVNDRDFTILGKLLSGYGLVATTRDIVRGSEPLDSNILDIKAIDEKNFITQKGYKGIYGEYPEVRKTVKKLNWGVTKKKRAYTNLTSGLGLVNIDALPLSNGRAFNLAYSFFVRPDSPALKFTDKFNREYTVPMSREARSSRLNCYTYSELREAREKENK